MYPASRVSFEDRRRLCSQGRLSAVRFALFAVLADVENRARDFLVIRSTLTDVIFVF